MAYNYGFHWLAGQYAYLGGTDASKVSGVPYLEFHCTINGNDNVTYLQVGQNGGDGGLLRITHSTGTLQVQPVGGVLQDFELQDSAFVDGQSVIVGVEFDASDIGSEVKIYFDDGRGSGLNQAASLDMPDFWTDYNEINRYGTETKLSKLLLKDGGINGSIVCDWDANYVPDGSGSYQVRSSTDAGYMWDLGRDNDSASQQFGYELINGISEVNGQSATQTITFGDTAQTISLPPTLTSGELLFSGVPVQYSYNQGAGTATFDAPNMGDLPGLTTIGEGNTISFDGNEITITTAVPAPYAVVDLIGPIYTGESSYTYGSNFTPAAGWQHIYDANEVAVYPDNQFDIVSSDGVIDFTGYSVDPSTGMQQYPVSNQAAGSNNPPTVDAGAARTATVGDTVQFGTNVTITEGDGTIDSLLWTQQAGPTVSINNAGVKNASATFSQAGSYEFPLTATDSNGETGSDVLYITVNEAVTDSTLNATITNIPDGTYDTRVLSTTGDVLFFGPKAWSGESASFTLTDVPAGTDVEYYVIGATEGGIDRGVTE